MPDLTKIPVPQYQPNQPYHWEYDNLPLKALADRDVAINNAVNNQDQILNEAAGTQGDLANRLNQSMDQDGNLKKTAIDESAHNIAKHEDGTAIVSSSELEYYKETLKYSTVSNPVEFVRTLKAERNKLALVAEEATSLAVEFCTDISCSASNIVLFDNQKIQIQSSSQIIWEHTSPNIIKPVLNISTEFAHRHYYNMDPITSDYINYDVTTTSTAYVEGSLRVYINGVKLNPDVAVYCPPNSNPSTNAWTLNRFTPNHIDGSFTLSNAVTEDDIVRVDFDVYLTTTTAPTITPTVTPTQTITPTVTPMQTITPTVTLTPTPSPSPAPFTWVTQPSSATLNSQTSPTFSYEYEHSDQLVLQGPYFEYSDNEGLTYVTVPVDEYTTTIFSSQLGGKTFVSGTFILNIPTQGFVSSRRYRIRATSGSSTFTSDYVFTVCAVTECSQYWPANYDGPQMSADCGLANEPGYTYSYNCNLCECIKSPIASPTPTPTATNSI